MARSLSEREWKVFREVREAAMERFCERVLHEIDSIAREVRKSHHERYLAVFKMLQDRDDQLASAFNNPRRSDAFRQLACLVGLELLSDEELARFSKETIESAKAIVEIYRG